ncbi:MAG: transcriptional regulator [Euryarchaeota archaeon]|jgi:hypothetical protein|nr:transcriptional regulator [Euryarchaeota archaeon]
MTEPQPPNAYEDINEAVKTEWKGETTPAERVKEVIRHVYTPKRSDSVADDALTTVKTARKHLENLAADGFVTTSHGPHGATLYQRSAESLIVERANRILSELSTEELATRVGELQAQVREYREEYGVDSPEELAIELGNEALSGSESDTPADRTAVTEWQTTRRNLAFANAALSIGEATDHVAGNRPNSTPATN